MESIIESNKIKREIYQDCVNTLDNITQDQKDKFKEVFYSAVGSYVFSRK